MRLTPRAQRETIWLTTRAYSETHAMLPLCDNSGDMQQGHQIRMQDGAQGQNGKAKQSPPKKRHGGRVVLSLDVDEQVRDSLRERAAATGVSMAQYLTNAIARPEPPYATSAVEIAQPLAQISYIVAQIRESLHAGDVAAALESLSAAQDLVAAALRPLQKQHATEYRANERRRSGGWRG